LSKRYLLIIMGVCLGVGLVIQQLVWYHVVDINMTKSSGVGLMIGLTGTVLLLNMQWKAKWLIWIGSFAYTIYLFHAFGTAGARIIINRFGIESTAVIFFASLFTGIFVPVLVEKVFDRFGITRFVFLGRSYSLKGKGD
jgi:glucans biosynthesis protein C